MSVSLTMIPVALALRVVMGKEKFNNWIQSMEIPQKTTFKSERDLITTVKQCGYDAQKWGGSIKTHMRGEKEFFFWEVRDGAWQAIFSKYDNMDLVKHFMQTLEQRSGRNIFVELEQAVVQAPIPQQMVKQIFPTNFRDFDLLKKVLEDNEFNPVELKSGQLSCDIGNAKLNFNQDIPDSIITVELSKTMELQSVFRQLSLVDEDYKSYLQERAYQDVLTKAEERGLTVEQEQILPDNSIVLTLNIQR